MGSLTEVQHAVVIGTLLGDGAMRCKTNALLEINHSAAQAGYVDWKYRQLAEIRGCRSRNAVYLNTQQFDLHSQKRLLQVLSEQWGIAATLNRDKIYHRIRVSVTGTVRLEEVIAPHVLPELRYKLPHVTP